MATRGILRTMGDGLFGFWCPGCNELHMVNTDKADRPSWDFNGDHEAPTFSPSILVIGVRRPTDDELNRLMNGENIPPTPRRCHSFVRNGWIEYLADCTHRLAGATVALPAVDVDHKEPEPA